MAKERIDVELSQKFKKAVPVVIDPKEVAKKKDRGFELMDEIDQWNQKIAPVRDKLKELRTELARVRSDVKSGTEMREIWVYNEFDYNRREVRLHRSDTKELIDTRAMTEEDMHEDLPKTGGKRPAGEPEDEQPN